MSTDQTDNVAPQLPTSPAELDAGTRRIEAENRARELSLLESAVGKPRMVSESLSINGQQLVNRMDYLPQGFGLSTGSYGMGIMPYVSTPDDRREGRDRPFIETEQDVAAARAMARFVATTTCPGVGIVENLTNYVISGGIKYAVGTKKHSEAPPGLVAAVQDVVDEFLDENDFVGDLDRELFGRSIVEGEYFLSTIPTRDGRTDCRIVEPELVVDPGSAPFTEGELWDQHRVRVDVGSNWTFGVHTADHDIQQRFGYCLRWCPEDGYDYLPARYVQHYRRNVGRNVKRGLTDFYPAWEWLLQQRRLLLNTGEGASEQASIAYIIQHAEDVSRQQAFDLRRAMADFSYTTNTPFGSKTVYKEYRAPGTKLDVDAGRQYLPGPTGHERGSAFLDVVQGILRQVGSRWAMSEGMISGNDANNNFASSLTAGSRFERYCTAHQGTITKQFLRIVWKAVEHAYNAGRFQRFGFGSSVGDGWREFMRRIEITPSAPPVSQINELEQEQIRGIRLQNKLLSRRSARTQIGLDNELEELNIAAEGLGTE